MSCKGASPATQKKYDSIIASLFRKFTGKEISDKSDKAAYKKDLSQFTKTKKFIKFMEATYPKVSTRVSYFSIIKCALVRHTRYVKAIAVYQKYFDNIQGEHETNIKSQTIQEGENKKADGLKGLQTLARKYNGDIFNKTLISCYLFIPSRRNMAFRLMKHSKNMQATKQDMKSNHVYKNKKNELWFVYNQYKNLKNMGIQEFKVKNPFLIKVLNSYLDNIEHGDYLFANRRNEHYSTGGFSNKFKKASFDVLGKTYLINDMRRSWITSKLKLKLNQLQKDELSKMMGSNFLINYNKLGDIDSLRGDEIF